MVKDLRDSERGNPLLPLHGLFFFDQQQRIFYIHHPTGRIAHTTAFITESWITGWKEKQLSETSTTDRTTSRRSATELHLAQKTNHN